MNLKESSRSILHNKIITNTLTSKDSQALFLFEPELWKAYKRIKELIPIIEEQMSFLVSLESKEPIPEHALEKVQGLLQEFLDAITTYKIKTGDSQYEGIYDDFDDAYTMLLIDDTDRFIGKYK